MYEENRNPFKRVGFHTETEPAQKKTLRPMTAPILTPGQRYGGSALSSANSQHMDPERPAIPPVLKKPSATEDTSAFSRLGERAAPAPSSGSLWRAPSFADEQPAYTPSFAPPPFPAAEPEEEEDFFLPPMDAPVEPFPANQRDDDEPEPSPAEDAAPGVRPMRGFGLPVFFGDASGEDDDAAIPPEPPAKAPDDENDKPRRRSRRDRHAPEGEDAPSLEPLYSAAPHAQEPPAPAAKEDWQEDPLYAHPAPYLEYNNFDPDSVPQHSGFTLEDDGGDPFGMNAFQMGAAYAAGQSDASREDFSFLPQEEQPFAMGGVPMTSGFTLPDEESFMPPVNPYPQPEFPNDHFQDFTDPYPPVVPPADPAPEMEPMQFADFAMENYPQEDARRQEDLYRQYAQLGQQAAAPLQEQPQPRPVPAYTPRKPEKQKKQEKPPKAPPADGQEKPRFKLTRELLGTIGIIIVALIFLFLIIAAGRAVKSFMDNQTDMQRHQQEYWDSHGYTPQDAAVMVGLPPAGQTIPPTASPTPLPTTAPTAPPVDEQDVGALSTDEAVSQATPERSRLLRYPDNPLTDMLPDMETVNKEYPDVKGQLVIPGLMDEMVVQSASGSYLSRNYRGTASPGGSVYMAEGITLKIPPENMILRASDSASGKGFNLLWQYRTGGAAFCSQHAFATLTTLYEEEHYVLFAVVAADTARTSPNYFSFADKLRFTTDADMLAFVEDARSRSLYYFPVDVLPTDRLLTLATVSGSSDGQCMVLLFRMLRDGEAIP